MANKIAKKVASKTKGVYVIQTEQQRLKALKWTEIDDVWGIGRQHAKRLKTQAVFKAYDFIQLPDEWVRQHMSVVGLRLKRELEGKPTLHIDEIKTKKVISDELEESVKSALSELKNQLGRNPYVAEVME